MIKLFEPMQLRGTTLPNRIVISPMCQYSAEDGFAGAWHMVQYGRFAVGGAGTVMVEASAVSPEGRITHGDVGIWSDAHADKLAPIAAFIRGQGAVPAIQLGHAGRKASMQRPWFGNGALTQADFDRGDMPWEIVAPSAVPQGDGHLMPAALDDAGLARIRDAFAEAARRADAAGFDIVEIHNAHGYLLHSFLSPLSNHRNDGYGGDAAGRMRFPLEVARAVRAAFPPQKPVFLRLSVVDGAEGGRPEEESIAFAAALKEAGIDVVDCSSGGITGTTTGARVRRDYGFQVPFAARIRREAGIATMAVGLLVDPHQAEAVLAEGSADLIAIGRQALEDPNWPLHALAALSGENHHADRWPKQHGWWLDVRDSALERLGPYVKA
ncbi:2,4-dienoyl-CoA reductase-like NADH-dependent reductase (Old Yellow Enzyme family) [Humitalea rosea]|uniref:2,4-dienoyl-CoA reductase-like NADH-dependent reductase (Old Yellow Enzyme family) n=1 Tax=Humitalea rosea TaxID=990373 RepID=A0A2W7IX80_9PROT|nr:NADH:flavin oxidoreductase/NADH oxidase [Humitalea rosea]PZW50795.1 2,4-dienoyl-CoA reductase-like NADH-dependent reductase (Old Yellow Enzyme family) [Humitalea rosea]